MRRLLGFFFLGLLCGGMMVHLNHAHRLEQLYWDKEKLKVRLFETAERLSRIEKMWADRQEEGIASVTFIFQEEVDPYVELELQRLAGEITAELIGVAIKEVQPDLLVALLHRRKLTVEKKDYLVTVNWVVVAPGTVFNLDVAPAPANG